MAPPTFLPPLVLPRRTSPFSSRSVQRHPRHGRVMQRIWAKSRASPPTQPQDELESHTTQSPSTVSQIPTLLSGPEAVVGIILAAASLLTEFAQSLSRLLSQRSETRPMLAEDVEDVEATIDELERALSASKAALAETEKLLDASIARANSAELALSGIGESQERLREALERKMELEGEVGRVRGLLEEELGRRMGVEGRVGELEKERERVLKEIEKREGEIRELREGMEKVRVEGRKEVGEIGEKEERLVEEIEKRDRELETVREERVLLGEMKKEMEEEVAMLKRELGERDKVVNEVALESDELRSLLAARDAELRELSHRLMSAAGAESEVGDGVKSGLSLEEIGKNLEAEQMALSAEIAKAEIKKQDICEEELDALDRVRLEMGAEGDLLKAGLRKAESTVKVADYGVNRREEAVEGVLESVRMEEGEKKEEGNTRVGRPRKVKIDKPKRKRGRPKKHS